LHLAPSKMWYAASRIKAARHSQPHSAAAPGMGAQPFFNASSVMVTTLVSCVDLSK
jgi:hypothetical protein